MCVSLIRQQQLKVQKQSLIEATADVCRWSNIVVYNVGAKAGASAQLLAASNISDSTWSYGRKVGNAVQASNFIKWRHRATPQGKEQARTCTGPQTTALNGESTTRNDYLRANDTRYRVKLERFQIHWRECRSKGFILPTLQR